jgi:hypothetical protein
MRNRIFIVVLLLAVAIGAPLGTKVFHDLKTIHDQTVVEPQRLCVNHLLAIESAKGICASEVGLKPGTVVSELRIIPYLIGGMPKCPAGGTYSINPIGKNPTCSVPGHKYVKDEPPIQGL